MTTIKINASCPYEIGEEITINRKIFPPELAFRFPAEPHTITDIVCEHSVKHGTVTFLYELDNSGKLVHIAAAPRPEQREAQTQSKGVTLIAEDESGPLPPGFVDFIKRRFG